MRRRLQIAAAAVCGGLALIGFARGGSASSGAGGLASAAARRSAGSSSSPSALSPSSASAASLSRGRRLFVSSCSACHGFNAEGLPGKGPSLRGVGALAADFYLQTGRMPLPSPKSEPTRSRPTFSQPDIAALVAYVGSFGGPPIPVVRPSRGSLARGQELFALDCAGCHTIQAQGGIVTGAVVPSLQAATRTQIGEAVRIGPYVMPRFGEGELSEGDVNSIARYIRSTQKPEDRGGWGIGRIGPIPEGMVAWLLAGACLLLIARLLGERVSPRRLR